MTKCKECGKRACFGKRGSKNAEYCKEHSSSDYVDVKSKRCIHPNCETQSNYGKRGSKNAEYCKEHSPSDYIDIKSRRCIHPNCETRPNYGQKESKNAEYCKEHSPSDYVDVKSKRCIHPNCETISNYGKRGSKNAEYCKEHSPSDYVDVKSKHCIHPNCETQPVYGKRGSKNTEYCSEHSPSDYVDIKHKRCIHPNCETQSNYGKRGSKNAEYCKEHSPSDYVNIKNKQCIHPNCETQPVYGKRGNKNAEYCKEHSPSDYVDIKSKRCIQPNCETRSNYGFAGYSYEYCAKHRLPRMIIYPLKHSKEDSKNCEYCQTPIHYNELFCSGCKKYIELETTVKGHQKELRVGVLLNENEIKYINDKPADSSCSKRRPDYRIPTKWGECILEVDENQHCNKTYSCECELTRMKQIYYDCGVEHLLFIRYNPDSYKTLSGKRMELNKREEFLIKYLKEIINWEKSVINLGVVYLFYDGFCGEPEIEEIKVV